MGFRIEHSEPGIVEVIYSGDVVVSERFEAHAALDDVLRDADVGTSLLIDLTEANVLCYGADHALALARSIVAKRRPYAKLAYLTRPEQADMAASVVGSMYGPSMFRRFTNRSAALDWLRHIGRT